jgi:hypothetical protein
MRGVFIAVFSDVAFGNIRSICMHLPVSISFWSVINSVSVEKMHRSLRFIMLFFLFF